ncbi:plasmid partition protein ParG [Rothia nasisuis]|uniref:plasmid partition protein ParG n=1 Tax=Rothia nasisuis TaxID=2109647 RepID=UPI001F319A69|nr:plasmid partition protein ParG [Rothia nasisuis]
MTEKKNLMTRTPSAQGATKADFKKSFTSAESAPKKQLTIKLDEARHRKLKTYASQNGTTITELVSGYIDSL